MDTLVYLHHAEEPAGLYCDVETWTAAGGWIGTQDLPVLLMFWRHRFCLSPAGLTAELAGLVPPEPLARHFRLLAEIVDPDGGPFLAEFRRPGV